MLDKWNARLLATAKYDSVYEIPIINSCDINTKEIKSIIPFSEILRTKNFNQWVCFYENDESFEKLWNRPYVYLETLRKFQGVITPDFSVYQDMPFAQQVYNIYRQRVIGCWLQSEGINVIVNVRWGDSRTYELSTIGVPHNNIIAIGTVGCVRGHNDTEDSLYKGLEYIIEKLKPHTIIVYGPAPNKLFGLYRLFGLNVLQFDSFKWRDREVHNG